MNLAIDPDEQRGKVFTKPHLHRCDECGDELMHEDLSQSCWEFDRHIASECKALDEILH